MKNLDYGLYAVIIHTGTKLDGGHYFTFARDSESDLTIEEDVM
jgi:ubiquitin C-terminal hydrolase